MRFLPDFDKRLPRLDRGGNWYESRGVAHRSNRFGWLPSICDGNLSFRPFMCVL